jgi:hypothetical protein
MAARLLYLTLTRMLSGLESVPWIMGPGRVARF